MAAVITFYHPHQQQYRTGLYVKGGDVWAHVVVYENAGVCAVRVPIEQETEFTYHDGHDLRRALVQYRDAATRVGISEAARKLLGEIERNPTGDPT